MSFLAWLAHLPRYFVGHLIGHVALLLAWLAYALGGVSDGLTQIARWLCDVEDGEDLYDGFDDDEGGDGTAPESV